MRPNHFLMFFAVIFFVFSSCKKDILPDYASEVANTYVGVFNSDNVQTTDYEVTVSKVSNTKIKITPQDDKGTEFEVTIVKADTIYTGSTNQVVLLNSDGVLSLTYNTTDGEQFVGRKK